QLHPDAQAAEERPGRAGRARVLPLGVRQRRRAGAGAGLRAAARLAGAPGRDVLDHRPALLIHPPLSPLAILLRAFGPAFFWFFAQSRKRRMFRAILKWERPWSRTPFARKPRSHGLSSAGTRTPPPPTAKASVAIGPQAPPCRGSGQRRRKRHMVRNAHSAPVGA